jgi:hypothetical protein
MKIAAELKNGTIVNLSHWDGEIRAGLVDVTDAKPPAKIGDKVVKGKVVPQPEVNLNVDMYTELMNVQCNGFALHRLKDLSQRYQNDSDPIFLLTDAGEVQSLSKERLGKVIADLLRQEQEILKRYA